MNWTHSSLNQTDQRDMFAMQSDVSRGEEEYHIWTGAGGAVGAVGADAKQTPSSWQHQTGFLPADSWEEDVQVLIISGPDGVTSLCSCNVSHCFSSVYLWKSIKL